MEKKNSIRIVVSDDHPIFRKGLQTVLAAVSGCEVVAEAENGTEALEKIREFEPDVAVLDVDMPERTGVEVVEELRKAKCRTEFIFLTMFKEKDLFDSAMELDVKGYVLKDNALTEIAICVKSVAKGQYYISPSLSSFVVQRSSDIRRYSKSHPSLEQLTPTEQKVLKAVAMQRTSKEIAADMNISVRTVEFHRAGICTKLQLKGPQALLRFALENKKIL